MMDWKLAKKMWEVGVCDATISKLSQLTDESLILKKFVSEKVARTKEMKRENWIKKMLNMEHECD